MSISPSRNPGSTSSSSSNITPQNPNPNHGLIFTQQHSDSLSYQTHNFQSLQISNSANFNATSNHNQGPVASASNDSGGSSKKVNDARNRIDKNSSGHQKPGSNSHRAWVASAPPHKGKLSETTVSPPTSQHTHGSTNTQSGGRKTHMVNGNHLLNFYYDPISRPHQRAPPSRRQMKRKPYNKDLFLQANYKFVMLDSGNHAPESMEPDKTLQWEDIICVKYSTPVPLQCPICLESLLCPQLTSCGHIFCFPCILRYFLMGDDDHKGERWKKCPLCFMMISSKDLYTVYVDDVKQHCVGDTIEFMLLTRQKDSFALSLKNNADVEVPDSFSKFTFTSDVDLSVRKAMSELDSWLARADSGLVDDLERLPYVCAAMEHLEQRKKYWSDHLLYIGNGTCKSNDGHIKSTFSSSATHVDDGSYESAWGSPPASVDDKPMLLGSSVLDKVDGDPVLDQIADVLASHEDQDGTLSSSYDEGKSMQRHTNSLGDRNDKDSYNFYQAIDGQHLILHPLNMKCLLHHYGGYDKLPNRICGKILQMEMVTQSEAMRRRYRYLSHFSLTTTFQLCEIDLNESLPPGALSPFIDEIKNRDKQRKRLARKEREEKIKAEAAAAADFVSSPSNFAQSSHDYFPTFSMDDFEALGSSAVTSSSPPMVGERPLFSNVARLGFAAGQDSPALKIDEAPHALPKTDGVATGTSSSSFANIISRAKPVESKKMNEIVKKGKKPQRVLLSTAGGRRY